MEKEWRHNGTIHRLSKFAALVAVLLLMSLCPVVSAQPQYNYIIASNSTQHTTSCGNNVANACPSLASAQSALLSQNPPPNSTVNFIIYPSSFSYNSSSNCQLNLNNLASVTISAAAPGVVIQCSPSDWIPNAQSSWSFTNIYSQVSISGISFINNTAPIGLYQSPWFLLSSCSFINCSSVANPPMLSYIGIPGHAAIIFMAQTNCTSQTPFAELSNLYVHGQGITPPFIDPTYVNFFLADCLLGLSLSNSIFTAETATAALGSAINLPNGYLFSIQPFPVQVYFSYNQFMSFSSSSFLTFQPLTTSSFVGNTFFVVGGNALNFASGIADSAVIDSSQFSAYGFSIFVTSYGSNSGVLNISNCQFYPFAETSSTTAIINLNTLDSVYIWNNIFDYSKYNCQESSPSLYLFQITGTTSISNSQFLNSYSKYSRFINGVVLLVQGSGFLSFTNCTFANNSIPATASSIFITYSEYTSITVTSCLFVNNSCPTGGPAFAIQSSGINPAIFFSNSTFIDNKSTFGYGGAVALVGAGASFTNCTFLRNQAFFGGAASIQAPFQWVVVSGCTFLDNTAEHAGALGIQSSSQVQSQWNLFKGNKAASSGGAVYLQAAGVLIDESTYDSNEALSGFGGAIFIDVSSFAVLGVHSQNISGNLWQSSNTYIRNNSALVGGGLFTAGNLFYSAFVQSTYANCTFEHNHATFGAAAAFAGSCFPVRSLLVSNQFNTPAFFFMDNEASAGGGDVFYTSVSSQCWLTDNTSSIFKSFQIGSSPSTAPFGASIATAPASLALVDSDPPFVQSQSDSVLEISSFPGQPLTLTFRMKDALGQEVIGSGFSIITKLDAVGLISVSNTSNIVTDQSHLNSLFTGGGGLFRSASGNITFVDQTVYAPPASILVVNLTTTVPNVLGPSSPLGLVLHIPLKIKTVECPAGYRQSVRSTSSNFGNSIVCLPCSDQQYNLDAGSTVCYTCDSNSGFSCSGSQVFANPGSWIWRDNSGVLSTQISSQQQQQPVQAALCPEGACIGATDNDDSSSYLINSCAQGRDPSYPMCGQCLPGYSLWWGSCIPCTSVSIPQVTALVFITFAFALFVFAISYSADAARSPYMRLWINYFQVVSIIRAGTMFNTGSYLSVADFDFGSLLISSTCPFPIDGNTTLALNMASTVFVFIALFIVIAIMRISFKVCLKYSPTMGRKVGEHQQRALQPRSALESLELKNQITLQDGLLANDGLGSNSDKDEFASAPAASAPSSSSSSKPMVKRAMSFMQQKTFEMWIASNSNDSFARSTVQLLVLAYQRLCGDSFRYFGFVGIAGHYYNATFPDISTLGQHFESWTAVFAITAVLSVILPFALIAFLRKHHRPSSPSRSFASSTSFERRFGLLWASFADDRWFWASALLLLRMILLLAQTVGTLMQNTYPSLRLTLLGLFLALSWSVQEKFEPFKEKQANILSTIVSVGLMAQIGLTSILEYPANQVAVSVAMDSYHGTSLAISFTVTAYTFYTFYHSLVRN